jgi:hypothetical protein
MVVEGVLENEEAECWGCGQAEPNFMDDATGIHQTSKSPSPGLPAWDFVSLFLCSIKGGGGPVHSQIKANQGESSH